MNKRKTVASLLCVFLFIATFCVNGSALAEDKVFQVKVHSQMPVNHFITKAVELFIKEANERSGGTLKFTHFPAQQLYKDTTIVEAVPDGLIEIGAAMNISPWGGLASEVNLAAMPAVWDDYDHYIRYCYDKENGGGYEHFLYEVAKKKLNVINLGGFPYGRNQVPIFNSPVKSLEDWKSKKIRVGTKAQAIYTEALDARSVFMSSSETYMALQRGLIDGAQSGTSTILSRKWYEVAKYMVNVPGLFPYEFHTFINLDFWNRLSKRQKRALADAWLVAAKYDEKAVAEKEVSNMALLKEKGVHIWEPPSEVIAQWKNQAMPQIKEKLINSEAGGPEVASKIINMIENTKGLPISKDVPNKLEVPFEMYEGWHEWFLKEEGLL